MPEKETQEVCGSPPLRHPPSAPGVPATSGMPTGSCDTQDRGSWTSRRADRPTNREAGHLLVVVAEGVRDAEF